MMSLEELNRWLFLLINGPADPGVAMLTFAKLCAALLVAAVPLYLIVGWLRGTDAERRRLLEAALACVLALLIAWVIGAIWPRPRPFMVPIGHALMAHAPNASFPSDHLTGIWSVAFSLLLHRGSRGAGVWLALLGLPVAWARIYLGIHFPIDMAGAALIALVSAWALRAGASGIVAPLFPWANTVYRRLCAPLIRRGWAVY
jgi:undecaprenyl-diphosphatase